MSQAATGMLDANLLAMSANLAHWQVCAQLMTLSACVTDTIQMQSIRTGWAQLTKDAS